MQRPVHGVNTSTLGSNEQQEMNRLTQKMSGCLTASISIKLSCEEAETKLRASGDSDILKNTKL